MFLQQLSLANFKNYEQLKLTFSQPIHCFTGPNGVGKTNLLDAIYYLCMAKSYFHAVDGYNVRHGEQFFMVKGNFDDHTVRVAYQKQKDRKKELFWDDVRYDKLADHIGKLPVVMVTPDDSTLITGGSEERRRFLDAFIAQTDNTYLQQLQQYMRIIEQRNALLKRFAETDFVDLPLLDIYTQRLVPLGTALYDKRVAVLEQFTPYFNQYYNTISGEMEEVKLEYDSKLNHTPFAELLAESLERDRILRYTSVGIHRDDIKFDMDEQKVKRFSSQGQQKSFLIALKLAEFALLKETKGTAPILLLDDIFDKLDAQRSANLLQFLQTTEMGQVFITDTREDRIREAFADRLDNVVVYRVEDGEVTVAS